MMKKSGTFLSVIRLLIIVLLLMLFSGCSEVETRTDTEPLLNRLPDIPIISACWYGGVKEDRYSGVGPCTYVIFGAAKIDAEFAQGIMEEYEWAKEDTEHIFELLARLDTKNHLDKQQNYLCSRDFTRARKDAFNSDVSDGSEYNMINLDVSVSFENNTVVFYAEYMDF